MSAGSLDAEDGMSLINETDLRSGGGRRRSAEEAELPLARRLVGAGHAEVRGIQIVVRKALKRDAQALCLSWSLLRSRVCVSPRRPGELPVEF